MKFTTIPVAGTITAVLAALLLSGTALAGDETEGAKPGMDPKPKFEELDANLDGVITKAEAQDSWLAAEFQSVDSDGNGLVNRSEYERAIS